jgi:hypothetical protein
MKMEQTGCSEMLAHKLQMLANHPEENTQHSECGEHLKSRRSEFACDGSTVAPAVQLLFTDETRASLPIKCKIPMYQGI